MKLKMFLAHILLSFLLLVFSASVYAQDDKTAKTDSQARVGLVNMKSMILPGTQGYLQSVVQRASADNLKAIIVLLDTPGGLLSASKEMIEIISHSSVPVVVYVGPHQGATATSAGVFITMAGHVAVMAPGTSIGAAHPVTGEGKDIEGDMRKKAEEMTVAMVKSIAEQRGRNAEWAAQSVRESSSITETEALEKKVIDFIAKDIEDLLVQLSHREVKLSSSTVRLPDLKGAEQVSYDISFRDEALNLLANPAVISLLFLGATTGITLELYNPGAIIPGVIGVLCLLLALAASQMIPVTQAGVLLLALGGILLASELFVASGFLGVAGVLALILGAITLVDVSQAPGLSMDYGLLLPVGGLIIGFLTLAIFSAAKARFQKAKTGAEAIIGEEAEVTRALTPQGKVFLHGETWNARLESGSLDKGARVRVLRQEDNMVLVVKPLDAQ